MPEPRKPKKLSNLACAVRSLLDESGLLSRKEWATLLGVTPPAISMWVNDKTLPRPEHLARLWDFVEISSGVPEPVLEEFRRVINLPADEVTPFSDRFKREPTVGHYMLRPMRESLQRTLATLAPSLQKQVLLETAERCRQLRAARTEQAGKLARVPWMLAPGTRISEYPELGELFRIEWRNVAIYGLNPRDTKDTFFRDVAIDLLTRPAPPGFRIYYVIPASNSSFAEELEELFDGCDSESRHRAKNRIEVLLIEEEVTKEILKTSDGLAEVLVAFDLGESSLCGYAWYAEDEQGVVLDSDSLKIVDKAREQLAEEGVLPFSPQEQQRPSDIPPLALERVAQ